MMRVFLLGLLGLARWHTCTADETPSGYVSMPGGLLMHTSCIHQIGSRASVEPCLFKSLNTAKNDAAASYYSDWSVYAQTVAPTKDGFEYFSSNWTVPSFPSSHGPAKQSSVYIFNGLEDGRGVHGAASVILQPVLQYGKSGCNLNPLKWSEWLLSSYVVDGNGRAHCAELISVSPGDVVQGIMEKAADSNEWTVTSIAPKGSSVNTVDMEDTILDAAYLTLEGMVIYGCSSYPPEGQVTFVENAIKSEKIGDFSWTEEVRHDECSQGTDFGSDGSVALTWDASL